MPWKRRPELGSAGLGFGETGSGAAGGPELGDVMLEGTHGVYPLFIVVALVCYHFSKRVHVSTDSHSLLVRFSFDRDFASMD